jgi:hypothetical protein
LREDHLSLDDVGDRIDVILRLERSEPTHDFEHGNPQGPHIDHFIIPPSLEHLRSSIEGSSRGSQHISLASPLLDLLADSEINDFYRFVVLVVKYVFGFDVPMANLPVVDIPESVYDLISDLLELLLRFND